MSTATPTPATLCARLGFIAGLGSLACEQRGGYLGFEPSRLWWDPRANVCAASVEVAS